MIHAQGTQDLDSDEAADIDPPAQGGDWEIDVCLNTLRRAPPAYVGRYESKSLPPTDDDSYMGALAWTAYQNKPGGHYACLRKEPAGIYHLDSLTPGAAMAPVSRKAAQGVFNKPAAHCFNVHWTPPTPRQRAWPTQRPRSSRLRPRSKVRAPRPAPPWNGRPRARLRRRRVAPPRNRRPRSCLCRRPPPPPGRRPPRRHQPRRLPSPRNRRPQRCLPRGPSLTRPMAPPRSMPRLLRPAPPSNHHLRSSIRRRAPILPRNSPRPHRPPPPLARPRPLRPSLPPRDGGARRLAGSGMRRRRRLPK